MKDDQKAVKEILSGNESALREFYLRFQPRLVAFIKAKIEDPHDAEEVLQDTLLATLESLRDFSFRSSLNTFICSIAMHKIIDYYRRKKIKNIVFSKIPEMESILSTLIGPEDVFDKNLIKSKVKETFRKITPVYSTILKMKYLYGYSVVEIAEKLSISFKSAESMLFRARKAFVAAYSL